MVTTPLQVVFCWHASDEPSTSAPPHPFIEAAYRAFAGRSAQVDDGWSLPQAPNWIAGAELTPVELRRYPMPPPIEPARLLDGALHTLVVAWVCEKFISESPEFVKWLSKAWSAVDASESRHGLLLGVQDERLRQTLCDRANDLKAGSLDSCQMRTWESLGEPAARPATVALRALEKARAGLTRGMGQPRQRLRLFMSHAKIDGLALAESLTRAVKGITGLEQFYDAQDIEMGSNWRTELKGGVDSSVLVALRTDQYDKRFWCIQEVEWAESSGTPIIVVEARSELFHSPSDLHLEGCPWVRIPDGSLTRILYCALRENLRLLLIRRGILALGATISKVSIALPRIPTWTSLDGALGRLPARHRGTAYIVYPDPKGPKTTCEALDRFVAARKRNVQVVNYSSLVSGAEL
jgi:hypothetical protein